MSKKFLALVGSPRQGSTSGHFADYIGKGLASKGWEARTLTACSAIRRSELWSGLESAFLEADTVGIITPLYVDSLPSELIAALDRLAASARADQSGTLKKMFAVLNCGFAESHQNDLALDMCRLFAKEVGAHWMGGLAIGGGGMLGGKPLEEQKGPARNVIAAFDGILEAVDQGGDIPETALEMARRLSVPEWMYFAMANLGMAIGAAQNGALFHVAARPNAKPR
jgi:NAD(P)H-dependent FMN reductase